LGAVFNRLDTTGYYALENCKEEVSLYFSKFKPNYIPFGFIPEIKLLEKPKQPELTASVSITTTTAASSSVETMPLSVEAAPPPLENISPIPTSREEALRESEKAQNDPAHQWREADEIAVNELITTFMDHVDLNSILSELKAKFMKWHEDDEAFATHPTNVPSNTNNNQTDVHQNVNNQNNRPPSYIGGSSRDTDHPSDNGDIDQQAPTKKRTRAEIVANAKSQGASGG